MCIKSLEYSTIYTIDHCSAIFIPPSLLFTRVIRNKDRHPNMGAIVISTNTHMYKDINNTRVLLTLFDY